MFTKHYYYSIKAFRYNLRNKLTHHCHPSQGRNALADSRQVVKQTTATVLLSEGLDLLDLLGDGPEEVCQLCLIREHTHTHNQLLKPACEEM